MTILRTQRSIEPCVEGGFFAYYLYFDAPVSDVFVESLEKLGTLTFMRNLRKPFYLTRGKDFLIRGQTGDDFCKVGIRDNKEELLSQLCCDIERIS